MRISSGFLGLALAAGLLPGLAQAEGIFGLTTNDKIVVFESENPGTFLSSRAIIGLGGDTLVGIDFRPANNTLYSVSTAGNLFRLDLTGATYTANLVGNIGVDLRPGMGFGIDFNPTVDRLRLIDDADQNLRINPNSAATLTDIPIGGGFDIIGSAYTNSFVGATSTTLYGLDAAGDQLLRSTNPNGGVYVSVGSLGVPLVARGNTGFDISGLTGRAYFNDERHFFRVNLSTGAATHVGLLDTGSLVGLTAGAAIPEPSTWAMMILGFGAAGATLRRRRAALA